MPAVYFQYDDSELLQQLAGNNPDAFEMIYQRHWEEMYRTAWYLTKDAAISKDIVQEIFIWLWENRLQLQIGNLKAYLKAAVRFKVANAIRSGTARAFMHESFADHNKAVSTPTPEELTEFNELKKILQQAINKLPDKCREIYLLKREEKLTNQQVADRLGISAKTVENQMTIAQRKIRSSLDPYGMALILFGFLCQEKIFF